MMRRAWIWWLAVAAMLPLLGLAQQRAVDNDPRLSQADKLWREKSFGPALTEYEAILAGGKVSGDTRSLVEYRIAVCLGKTQKWDRALAAGLEFVKSHQRTVWEPRGLYWLGRLYLAVPSQGWRVGKQVYRGNDVPKVEGAEKPEHVHLGAQDQRNSRDALEAARVFFPEYRARYRTEEEEIQLNHDLAGVLQSGPSFWTWAGAGRWAPPGDPSWKIDPAENYSPDWAPPKKLQYLYAGIERLGGRTDPKSHAVALGLLGRALWLRQYHGMMAQHSTRYEPDARGVVKQIKKPYPYQDDRAEPHLRRLAEGFRGDPISDQAWFTLAMWSGEDGNLKGQEQELRRFVAERPQSKWVEDARAQLHQLARASLSLSASQALPERDKPSIQVSFRNLSRIRFRVYRVALEQHLTHPARLQDPSTEFHSWREQFGTLQAPVWRRGTPVASWTWETTDKGDHLERSERQTVPVREVGAYVVEAEAPSLQAATLLVISNLAIAQTVHRDGALVFVADALSGGPVSGATVYGKQWWSNGGSRQCRTVMLKSNVDGLVTVPFERGPGRSGFQFGAFAYTGSRYALTQSGWSQDYGDNPDTFRTYSITDRAVYRPRQEVQYRQVVFQRRGGEWKPAAHQAVTIGVIDPKGTQIHQQTGSTNEFGSVHGALQLADGAPLGEYQINLAVVGSALGQSGSGANRFRVEEYKKPEFEVAVVPGAERVRLGEPVTAKIRASYYFGGPAAGAKVTYRVHRTGWQQQHRFPRPFDFLYRNWNQGDYDTGFRNGPIVKQGEARTNDQGEAEIRVETAEDARTQLGVDFEYTVEAEVQDSSRRVISGSGSVKATRHDVAVFLDYPHGYASQGERLVVEVATLNPAGEPVATSGTVRVSRQPDAPGGRQEEVHSEPLRTDAQGRGYLRWSAEQGGVYTIIYQTRDSAEQPVSGAASVWVAGSGLDRSRLSFQRVELRVKELYYEEGQTAKVLLTVPKPGCTVLLTREAGSEVLGKQVVRLEGFSREIELSLSRRDVPNVHLRAMMIRDGQAHQAVQELFVPAARQFARVTVRAEKDRYHPGEKARLALHAEDWRGRPLRTELSVAVTDASLGYIQKSYAPDVRVYYYGDRRSQSSTASSSLGFGFPGDQEDRQPTPQFKTHEWTLPDGMGLLSDWPGASRVNLESRLMWPGRQIGSLARERGRMNGAFGGGGFGGGGFGGGGFGGGRYFYAAAAPALSGEAPAGGSADGFKLRMETSRMLALGDEGRADGRKVKQDTGADPGGTPRTQFADTAFWTPAAVTDAAGNASVEVTWPDNLTQWQATAVGATEAAQVGSGDTTVRTRKDLLVRLQAPRFFVERDRLVLTANVHNYQEQAVKALVRLDLAGDTAELVSAGAGETTVDVPAGGEKRVDWDVRVLREGSLKVRMSARSPKASDATEQSFPVLVHGVERMVAQGGVLRKEREAKLPIELPAARKPGSSELVVQLNPSLGAVMLDALPYLADYPYGCIEQTTSRFIPAVVVSKTLKDLGYDLNDLAERARQLAQQEREAIAGPLRPSAQVSPYSYPAGRPGRLTPKVPEVSGRWHNPVFEPAQLASMVREGLGRIMQFQHSDGGWGWWPGDSSDPYMTSYVLYGLLTARDAGHTVDAGMLSRGLEFLRGRFAEDANLHRQAYEARVLAMEPAYRAQIRAQVAGRVYERRERLSTYSKALLATALFLVGEKEKAGVLLRNLEGTAKIDRENGTATWSGDRSHWWEWYENQVETVSAVLQAHVLIQPEAELSPMLVKWLVNNRRGTTWNSTRETAMAVYAMTDYVRQSKELAPEYSLTVDLGGQVRRSYTVTQANALFFDNQFIVPDELLRTGSQTLTLTKDGPGALYYAAYTRYFSLEEPIRATGNEIAVSRRYFRLLPGTATGAESPSPAQRRRPPWPGLPEEGIEPVERPNPFLTRQYALLDQEPALVAAAPTDEGPRYERVALESGTEVKSGDLIEVELALESKNEYSYLVFEDLKPAGCEAVALRSGGHEGQGLYSNMELRDQKVAFFLTSLPQGRRVLSYRLRAEIPGEFHALPTNGYHMYAPDIRAISDEMRLRVRDE
jgi:uncharacterized protein YfaS (alpha-2-macroglobulin family)